MATTDPLSEKKPDLIIEPKSDRKTQKNREFVNTDIVCPVCRSTLIEEPFAGESLASHEALNILKEGLLICDQCQIWYPVYCYIPVMLTFKTSFHQYFQEKFFGQSNYLSTYSSPEGKAEIGEEAIQKSFTDEWNTTNQNEEEMSFTYTVEDLINLNKYVWLRWLESDNRPSRILNVGCGLGNETLALAQMTGAPEAIGVDLNFALFRRGAIQKNNPNVHFVIASLFQLPFPSKTFDLVYSQGVLHHTYSTELAFENISKFVNDNGKLFVWVYGLDDHLIKKGMLTLIVRAKFAFETMFRPFISRQPKFLRDVNFLLLSLLLHPFVKLRVRNKALWKLQNTNHSLRDWLSHRYAHRHSYNQVLYWFEKNGYQILDCQSPYAYQQIFYKTLWGVGLTGIKKSFE